VEQVQKPDKTEVNSLIHLWKSIYIKSVAKQRLILAQPFLKVDL